MTLKERLASLLEGEVEDDPASLDKFSRDASIFEVTPQVVAHPKNTDDLKKLVNFVNREKRHLSLTARSAGTDMGGGSLTPSIMVEMMKHFNRVKEVSGTSAVTEPGVFYRDFEKETLKHDLLLPSYPASREICSVGGMVANNSGGEKSLTFGKTENYVTKLKVVLSDGNEYVLESLSRDQLAAKMKQTDFEGVLYSKIFKIVEENFDAIKSSKPNVSKNSAGYNLWDVWDRQTFDLTKLFVGSQGTLGIATEIKFNLVKPQKHSQMLVIFLKDLDPLVPVVHQVLPHKPESFESYDDHTFNLAIKYLPELIKILKPHNVIGMAFKFIPELWMMLTKGFPKLVMIAEFTGETEAEARTKAEAAQRDLISIKVKTQLTKTPEDAKKYWVIRRESFNLLRHHVTDKKAAPFIDDIVVRPEMLPEFLPQLNKILDKYKLTYTMAGHIGDGNFHIIPLMNLKDKRTHTIIPELSEKVFELVFQYKGSMSGEHNDGLIRSPYLKQMYGENIFELFKETKLAFDPHDIFNPGKKIGSSLEYNMDHIQSS